jgi:tyrosine-specific transport protein
MGAELKVFKMSQSEATCSENKNYSKSKFIGALLIVAGTTVGAGMLALPMTSNKIGFVNSLFLLVGMWAFMCFAALITVEINLRLGGGYSIAYIAEKYFGKLGKYIASLSMGLLFYALLSAYTTGGASFLRVGLESVFKISVPFTAVAIVFTSLLGAFVYSSMRHVDFANRFLLFFKTSIFFILVYFLIPFVKTDYLALSTLSDSKAFWLAIPIFFTSFGFHGSIPSLINYVGTNRNDLRKVIVIGSFVPLLVYILWQVVTLGVLSSDMVGSDASNDVASFVHLLNQATISDSIGYFSNIFAFFGVSTSFLGVAIGLFDYIAETFKKSTSSAQRLQTALLTFLPPLFFAIFFPNGFIMALGYAAVALSVLAVLLPAAVALKHKQNNIIKKTALLGLFAAGIGIIAIELLK